MFQSVLPQFSSWFKTVEFETANCSITIFFWSAPGRILDLQSWCNCHIYLDYIVSRTCGCPTTLAFLGVIRSEKSWSSASLTFAEFCLGHFTPLIRACHNSPATRHNSPQPATVCSQIPEVPVVAPQLTTTHLDSFRLCHNPVTTTHPQNPQSKLLFNRGTTAHHNLPQLRLTTTYHNSDSPQLTTTHHSSCRSWFKKLMWKKNTPPPKHLHLAEWTKVAGSTWGGFGFEYRFRGVSILLCCLCSRS